MRILLVIALVSLLVAVPGTAQNPENLLYQIEIDKNENGENKVFASFRERNGKQALFVTVQFKVVRIANNTVATDVSKDDIVVREDGRKVAELEITVPTTQELTTVLAMDISGSMASRSGSSGLAKIDEAKQAARIFLERLDTKFETGLVLFDHEMRVREAPLRNSFHFAEHRKKLRRLIDASKPGGGTAYLDAASVAVRMLKGVKGRKAVLLMTDGVDMNSKTTLPAVIQEAKNSEVPIYTLGIGEPGKYETVTTVLVLDHSGSMRGKADATDKRSKIYALHRAGARFIELMRPGARTTLLPFSTNVETPEPFSTNKDALKHRIKQLQPEGGTLLYDATYAGIETLLAARPTGRKAVVVMTDGKDESPGSRHSDLLVIERAKEENIPLYMLGLGQPEEINEGVMERMAAETGGKYFHAGNEQRLFEIFEKLSIDLHDDGIDEKSLRELADKTGGKYVPARDVSQLKFIYEKLAEELQSTYTVTFASRRSSHDGTARDIGISVERNGVRLSKISSAGYNVHGVVVPDMDYRIYLVLLMLLGAFLLAPMGVRYLHRLYGGV